MNTNEVPQKYLPLGTVCRLKNGQKSIMVSGFGAINVSEKKIYDYMGVLYPEGQITSDVSLMFDHDQIEKVEFMGYNTDENTEFQKELSEYMTEYAPSLFDNISVTEPGQGETNQNSAPATQTLAEALSSSQTQQTVPVAPATNPTVTAPTGAGVITQPLTATPVNTENNN